MTLLMRRRSSVSGFSQFAAFDSVTRADSTSSPGVATEKGGAWTVAGGVAGVTGGALYSNLTANTRILLGVVPNGNCIIQATTKSDDWTNHPVNMMVRYIDTNNYIGFCWTGPANGSIRSMIGGVLTPFATWTPTPNLNPGQSYAMKFLVSGNSITIFQDGVQQGGISTLTGGIAAINGTQCGLWWTSAAAGVACTADNYSVQYL